VTAAGVAGASRVSGAPGCLLHSPSVRPIHWIAGVALVGACGTGSDDGFRPDPPRGPAMAQFADVTGTSGVDFEYATRDFKGGGLAVVDLDGDGRPDIVAGSRLGGLALFRNLGALRFARVDASRSGLDATLPVTAIAAADLDNDGDRDLVLASANVAYVMANQGDGTFVQAARFEDSGTTEHILPVDLDGDGLLDLFFGNYDVNFGVGTLSRLYMNRGGLAFGFAGTQGAGRAWTTTAFDVDGDGDQDLYVADDTLLADFGVPGPIEPAPWPIDRFLRNDGPGPDGVPRFTDIVVEMGLDRPRSSMSGVLGDFDDDGRLDLYVTDFGANKLFLRDPSAPTAGFVDRAAMFGVDGTVRRNAECGPDTEFEDCLLLSWSAALSDFDLDGYDELLVVNGNTEVGKPPPVLMFARGPALPYHEVSPSIASLDARGMIVTDLDGDGDQDVVIASLVGPLKVYKNVGKPAAGAWLQVVLDGHASNRDGVGAVVTLHMASGRNQIRVVGAGGVIHSASPAEAFFGLGHDAAASVEVLWPSGQRTELIEPAAGAIVLAEGSAGP
jgi:enediyne biosynthesis protein E4